MKYIFPMMLITIIFSGCVKNIVSSEPKTYKETVIDNVRGADYNKPYAKTSDIYQNLNGAIVAIADQLIVSNHFTERKTIYLRESMFNELQIRKFKVTDFRGQDAVSVSANGEFHITRDVEKLKDHISATEYIVVGTYVKFENDSVLLNARILDSETGAIISTARVIYTPQDCKLFNLCSEKEADIKPANYGINIVKDKCSGTQCPNQKCKDGICDNSVLY